MSWLNRIAQDTLKSQEEALTHVRYKTQYGNIQADVTKDELRQLRADPTAKRLRVFKEQVGA